MEVYGRARKRWMPLENMALKQMISDGESVASMSDNLCRTVGAIKKHANRLGLKKVGELRIALYTDNAHLSCWSGISREMALKIEGELTKIMKEHYKGI